MRIDELLLHLFQAAHVTQINDAMYSGRAFHFLLRSLAKQDLKHACLLVFANKQDNSRAFSTVHCARFRWLIGTCHGCHSLPAVRQDIQGSRNAGEALHQSFAPTHGLLRCSPDCTRLVLAQDPHARVAGTWRKIKPWIHRKKGRTCLLCRPSQ